MQLTDNRIYHRTIALTPERRRQIAFASGHLGISGERLIQEAITEYLCKTYGQIIVDR